MEINLKLEEIMRAYLLGNLPPGEQEKLEEQLMSQDDTFAQLLIHEDELIDEYLSGGLSAQEREAFERYFLAAPERRQKLGFAQALTRYVDSVRKEKKDNQPSFVEALMALLRLQQPVVRYSFALIALVLTVGIAWPILEVVKLKNETDQLRAHQTTSQTAFNDLSQQISDEQKRNQDLTEQLRQQQQSHSALEEQLASIERPAIVSFPLTPGQVRDFGVMKKLVVPAAGKLVELSLSVDGENYKDYRAVLEEANGEEVVSLHRLKLMRKDGSGVIVMPIPAGLLDPGDYIVKLSGINVGKPAEDIGKYYFRISRK